jgi:DnaJ-class molecular chaperone
VAAEDTTRAQAEEASSVATPCSPCRGTGKVVPHLAGAREELTCPWCDGSGQLVPGHDAQARWRDEDGVADGEPAHGRSETSTAPTVRSDA